MVGKPNRDRQAERREATRREILAAAWEIAHESGLISVTLREIAARIGQRGYDVEPAPRPSGPWGNARRGPWG